MRTKLRIANGSHSTKIHLVLRLITHWPSTVVLWRRKNPESEIGATIQINSQTRLRARLCPLPPPWIHPSYEQQHARRAVRSQNQPVIALLGGMPILFVNFPS